jgi:hypothetical protein
MKETNIYNRFLPLHTNKQLLLLDIDVQVPPLEIASHFCCDVQVADCLGPFVRKSSLLSYLFCTRCCFFLGSRICVGRYNGLSSILLVSCKTRRAKNSCSSFDVVCRGVVRKARLWYSVYEDRRNRDIIKIKGHSYRR